VRWFVRWRSAEPAADPRDEDATPIQDCTPGEVVDVVGTVLAVQLSAPAESPALEIELDDGTGTVTCIWLGRRAIEGIKPGKRLAIHGRLTCSPDRRTIFNPRYELRSA
jgi:RecG-like helicase